MNNSKETNNIIDDKLAIAALIALNGQHTLKEIKDIGYEFIFKNKIKNIYGIILCQDYEIQLEKIISDEELLHFSNLYFSKQFKLIEDSDGIITQLIGDAFIAYWDIEGVQSIDHILKALSKIKNSMTELNDYYRQRYNYFSIKKIITYIDVGHFILGKNGSSSRFNYCLMGDSINKNLNIASSLIKVINNEQIFIGENLVNTYKLKCQYFNSIKLKQMEYKIYSM